MAAKQLAFKAEAREALLSGVQNPWQPFLSSAIPGLLRNLSYPSLQGPERKPL